MQIMPSHRVNERYAATFALDGIVGERSSSSVLLYTIGRKIRAWTPINARIVILVQKNGLGAYFTASDDPNNEPAVIIMTPPSRFQGRKPTTTSVIVRFLRESPNSRRSVIRIIPPKKAMHARWVPRRTGYTRADSRMAVRKSILWIDSEIVISSASRYTNAINTPPNTVPNHKSNEPIATSFAPAGEASDAADPAT